MGRPPSPNARTHMVCVRLNDAELAALDNTRGGQSRGQWFRSLLRQPPTAPPEPITPYTINERLEAEQDWKDRS